MKKNKLLIDYQFDFELFGVSSAARGFKLAWEINRALDVQLVKQPDLLVGFRNGEERAFSFYAHETPLNRLKLFRNRPTDADSGKSFLIPEFPHYDFIILANMETPSQDLVESLKRISAIQLISIIPLEGLKSKSNFIF